METLDILILDPVPVPELRRQLARALGEACRVVVEPARETEEEGGLPFGEEELRRALAGPRPPAVVVLCAPCRWPGAERWASTLGRLAPGTPLFVASAAEEAGRRMELLRLGVTDCLVPPFRAAALVGRLRRAVDEAEEPERSSLRLRERLGLRHLVGQSPAFLEAVERLPLMARSEAAVLILGETGTGKEVFARALHYLSPRAGRSFIPVNCGALPLDLVENELFGHARAAYTGAAAAQHGLIAEAEGGTLFLDEVDCVPPAGQIKLLRFLQDKEYRPLGSPKALSADVRLVAATNTGVGEALREGRLRQDLYYRLNVLPLRLPPLRERREDIPLLARHFLAKYAAEEGRAVPELDPGALEALVLHDWPGNVRELEHVMERAVVLVGGTGAIRRQDILLEESRPPHAESFQEAKARTVARFERSYIESLLVAHEGNISRAARAAKKNRRAFWELIRKHGIDVDRFRPGSSA